MRCAIQCAMEFAMLHWNGEDAAEQNITIHELALGFSMPTQIVVSVHFL